MCNLNSVEHENVVYRIYYFLRIFLSFVLLLFCIQFEFCNEIKETKAKLNYFREIVFNYNWEIKEWKSCRFWRRKIELWNLNIFGSLKIGSVQKSRQPKGLLV